MVVNSFERGMKESVGNLVALQMVPAQPQAKSKVLSLTTESLAWILSVVNKIPVMRLFPMVSWFSLIVVMTFSDRE